MNFIYSLFNKVNLDYVVFVFENLTFSIILGVICVLASQFAETDQIRGALRICLPRFCQYITTKFLMLTLAPFIYWVFSGIKSKSLLIESCHLYAYIINPMCKKKKKMYSFLGFGGAGIFFIFCFSFCAQTFTMAPRQGQRVWGLGGSFWNVNLGLLKKVRTASDKFITRLNLIMSCSSSPFSSLLSFSCRPFPFPSVFLRSFNTTSIQT